MTFLECVNRVLRRLRENEVSTINETPYSKLISDLVNVVKVEIEDSWDWSVLRTTLTIPTTPTLFNYVLTGTGIRSRVLNALNVTQRFPMYEQSTRWFDMQFLLTTPQQGAPMFFNFNGVTANGDSQIDVYPVPDKVYTLNLNVVLPQAELIADADVIQIPGILLVEGTLARAISERGDDGGYAEQEQRFRNLGSDLIAIESSHRPDEVTWSPE